MPEISRFFGIIITMFAMDHNPPHFHVKYGDYAAIITIEDGIIKGELPRYAVKKVYEWLELHKAELEENWKRLVKGDAPVSIEPLI